VGKKSRAKLALAGTFIVNIVELILGVTYEKYLFSFGTGPARFCTGS